MRAGNTYLESIGTTIFTVMSALASSPLNPPAPRGASSPAPRPNGRYAPPNQGNRLNESAQRGHPLRTHPLTHPGGDAPRRFMAQDTGYLLPREEGGNRGIGMTRRMNFAVPTLLA